MEPLGGKHTYSMFISRYIKFIQNMICKSDKPAVQLMFNMIRDNMSITTGRNVRHIEDLFQCDILRIDDKLIKTKLFFHQIPDAEAWRINLIKEITDVQQNVLSINNEDTDSNILSTVELQDIIDFISSN